MQGRNWAKGGRARLWACGGLVCGGLAGQAGAQGPVGSLPNAPRMAAPQTMPDAPRAFEASARSEHDIRLYWRPEANATGYRIVRDGRPLATLPASVQEYDDTGLAPDSTHRYAIQSLHSDAASPPRETVERAFASFPISRDNRASPSSRRRARPAAAFDVVVVQASSGGVAAAIEAARRGLRTALVEPTTRLGGMPVNGLSATDLRRPEHASGFFVRFRDRVRDLYAREGLKTTGLQYAPRIAQQAMKSLLYEVPNLTIFRRARLSKVNAQNTNGDGSRRRVASVEIEELDATGTPTGKRADLQARVFVDATDCGDLAAWAGGSFRVGREPRSLLEPHNGVIYYDRASDKLLPGSAGRGDRRIQSYAYLLTVQDYGPGADKTIARPPGYRREDFTHTPDWPQSWAVTSGKMPDGKYELNQHPQGNDLQAINYAYPTARYATRGRIERQYRDHILAYLYYIQTEQGQKQIGLPDDEYRDTDGMPPLLYVREARRIVGEQAPTESDIAQARRLTRPESVGLGDYPMDSHAVRPKTDWTTPDMGEGEWWLYQYTPWHGLPLGVMVPRRLENVFVTTAVSSTHVSFGTYRLEPVRMAFGQAAGVAASLCVRYHLDARDVPARQIQDELLPHAANSCGDPNALLTYLADVRGDDPRYRAIQYLATRGFQFAAEELKPDAPTTRGELARWLQLLAERGASEPEAPPAPAKPTRRSKIPVTQMDFSAYMGQPTDRAAARLLTQTPDQTTPATRAEIAAGIVRVLRWNENAAGKANANRDRSSALSSDAPSIRPDIAAALSYADIGTAPFRADIEILARHNIDSRLWDGWNAHAPDGRLRFRPDAPLSHADLFATLYVAQIGLGPLFNDNPIDGKNGRVVPTAPAYPDEIHP